MVSVSSALIGILRALENLELDCGSAPGNQVKFVVRAPLGFRANSRVLRPIDYTGLSRHQCSADE